jgi:hypothetical protein
MKIGGIVERIGSRLPMLFGALCWLLWAMPSIQAQESQLQGQVVDEQLQAVPYAVVAVQGLNLQTNADSLGRFSLSVPANQPLRLRVSRVGYLPQEQLLQLSTEEVRILRVRLQANGTLADVVVEDRRQDLDTRISVYTIEPASLSRMPSAFGDFNKILATLPGVVSNSELSSTYAVRGGSFDENLVYVNDIETYRPQLVSAGQQEGLSFINPDLVQQVQFSAGGWEAAYGDRLASMLNVNYLVPKEWGSGLTLGLLGANAHIKGVGRNRRFSFVAGVRHKDARYLLATLPVEGEYFPRFTDVQAFATYQISARTRLQSLTAYAQNRYFLEPSNARTDFGTTQQAFSLQVAFEGSEVVQYDVWQQAFKLEHRWNERYTSSWILSGTSTLEREYFDIEAGYRLSNLVIDGSGGNRLANSRDIGTEYQSARNRFTALMGSLEWRNIWRINQQQKLQWGAKYGYEQISDVFREFGFLDSVGFVTPRRSVDVTNVFAVSRWSAYLQHTLSWGTRQQHLLDYGLRLTRWGLNDEWLFSPRFQYAFLPDWQGEWALKLATGMYAQPPFFRELRNNEGTLNLSLRAQKSWHFIVGAESVFELWGRSFKWTGEGYYKYLWDVVPYDVEDVRIRYFAQNSATAYALGADFRVSGEFVREAVSWFSLGILSTRENIAGDGRGYIRRPTDQRLTFAAYFEDYIPKAPTWRVNLHMILGTGLPFGPPQRPEFRAALNAPWYRRVDLGFSKTILHKQYLESLAIGLDVLNVLGTPNTISYTWVQDTDRRQYAVPNRLSTRFLNFKVLAKF